MAKQGQGEKMPNFAHRLRLQDNINTDHIISGRYKFAAQDPKEVARHIFEDIEEGFVKKIKQGDFLVAGTNFGCGSSREQAPLALKASGIKAVIAKNFARIFYRNAFNVGLCLVECDTNYIDDMDELVFELEQNFLMNVSKGVHIEIKPIPKIMKKFLSKGGMVQYFKEQRGFAELV
jgi:3-isopropylmalate/(R)-2-methylmalate dehydratase small subunit